MPKPVSIGDAESRIASAHWHDLEGNSAASANLGESVIHGAEYSLQTGDALESGQVSAWQRILSKAFSAVTAAREALTGRANSSASKPSAVNAASSNSEYRKRLEEQESARVRAEAQLASRKILAELSEAKAAKAGAMLHSADDDDLGLG